MCEMGDCDLNSVHMTCEECMYTVFREPLIQTTPEITLLQPDHEQLHSFRIHLHSEVELQSAE